MQPVPIYYENIEREESEKHFHSPASSKQKNEKRWHPEPRNQRTDVEISQEQWIDLFPFEDYGEYEEDFREVERRYNQDRAQFYAIDFHDPELIPAAEQLQDTLTELMIGAKILFDKFCNSKTLEMCAIAIMIRVSKDCYALAEEVGQHTKLMMDQYPDDEILHEDMKEIENEFIEFYLDVYSTLGRYKKKKADKQNN